MLTRGIVALGVATAFSSMALAADLPPVTAGLVDQVDGVGEAPLDLVDRPGFKLSHSFRLRLDIIDRLETVAHGSGPTRTALLDKRRARRFGSMLDFYPLDESGFHLTAGMRKLPRPQRRGIGGVDGDTLGSDLGGVSGTTALGTRSSIARRSPTLTAGWTGMVAKEMQVGFSAGATEEHGKSFAGGPGFTTDGANQRWSRVGGVAAVNLAMRF